MEWFLAHWWEVLAGIVTVASVVTKLTPTPKDDEWLMKIVGFLSVLEPKGAGTAVKLPFTPVSKPPA